MTKGVLLAALIVPLAARAATPCFVDYLYVDANEGSASGGHVAIRFGDRVYHFQHHQPGVLRLHRDDARHFFYTYGILQNRTISVSHIATSEATCALLRDRFSARYLIQSKQFDVLETLRADRALLETLLAHRRRAAHGDAGGAGGDQAVRLRGAGFFFGDHTDLSETGDAGHPVALAQSGETATPLVELRALVQRRYGEDFIRQRIGEIERELSHMRPNDSDPVGVDISEDTYPAVGYSFSAKYNDLMVGLMALHALSVATPLQPGTYYTPSHSEFHLEVEERAALRAYAERLSGELVRLVASARPDWGFALLIGMARLVALQYSLDLGRLVFLDAFPPDHQVIARTTIEQHRDIMPDLLDEARDELQRARTRVFARSEIREAEFSELEAASNRFLALSTAITQGRDLPVYAGRLLPSRQAVRADIIIPALSEAQLVRSLAQARGRERAYAEQLQRMYRYNLFNKNCVSEIFRDINLSFVGENSGNTHADEIAACGVRETREHIKTESMERLGGYIAPGWSLNFIPFVSVMEVDSAYNVVDTEEHPSQRKARLAEMYRQENRFVAYLRESNVITSTIYRRQQDDSMFLFFTDDIVAPRPIFGVFNLVTGLVTGAVGLALLPADGGHTLVSGLRGVLFSLPELAFFNIRKGSFDYVSRQYCQGLCEPAEAANGTEETVARADPGPANRTRGGSPASLRYQ